MNKPILYCDCDGVIFNTIETAFEMMENDGCNMSNKNDIDYFFRERINWHEVFAKSKVINDAINKIKILKESNIFSDVIILTKLSGNYSEEEIKRHIFNEVLPNIRVITLQYSLAKALVVTAKGNILIDDELRNCRIWNKEKGVAILFSPDIIDFSHNIVNDLMDIPNTNGVKKLLKTSNS